MQGVEDAILRNIQAVAELSDLVRTSFGPYGAITPSYHLLTPFSMNSSTECRKEQTSNQPFRQTIRYLRCSHHNPRDRSCPSSSKDPSNGISSSRSRGPSILLRENILTGSKIDAAAHRWATVQI
jgi:hypothetical protein